MGSNQEFSAKWIVVSKYAHLLTELDLVDAFGFWLKHSLLGWSVSKPAIERTIDGKQYVIFVLYQDGYSVGVYKTPMEALTRIGNDQLTSEYLSLISSSDFNDKDHGAENKPRAWE